MEYECGFAQLVTSALPLSLGCFRPQADPSSSRTRMPILYLSMAQELDRKHGPNCQKQHHHDQPEFPRYKFPHPLPPLRHLRSLQPSPRHPSPKKGRRAPQNTVVSALMMPVIMAWSSGDMWTILASAVPGFARCWALDKAGLSEHRELKLRNLRLRIGFRSPRHRHIMMMTMTMMVMMMAAII